MMRKRTEAEYAQLGEDFSQSLRSQIDELRPETIILSSEWFARAYNAPDAQKLFEFLESLGAEQIEILLYARRPSAFFLSASQQRLRAAAQFAPIFEWNVNGLIKGFEERCPSYTVTARSFDRQNLIGGSIVSDFAERYIPQCRDTLETQSTTQKDNHSFSPEAMVVLQEYRRLKLPDQEDVFTKGTQRLIGKLEQLDFADKNPRPKLKPGWKDYLDYGDARPLELRDQHGIIFSDFDYARLERGDFAPRPENDVDVADYVDVDHERLTKIVDNLAHRFWSPSRRNAAWIQKLASKINSQEPMRLPLWRKVSGW
ncbi:hypothetical protein [Yoonia sp. I 8.24]|uniref:hypothetical protein n=1 Tax=Yoonia sp. I 8.24 TaxID=1537229 RepID=UPI001EDEB6C5|nr:hypothetical protein [Yoonia sp. I 8.24]MCG3267921.1 hypothetical protein [Yoonia sp. I 8.24]